MKKVLSVALFLAALLAPSFSLAQNLTTLQGTVTDTGGQTWNYGVWTARLVIPGGGTKAVFLDGTSVTTSGSGVLSSAGSFTGTGAQLANTDQVQPAGSKWSFMLCPLATADCQSLALPISTHGSTTNVGPALSPQVIAPIIQAGRIVYAYAANEITNSVNGNGYINTVSGIQFYWQNGTYVQTGSGPLTAAQIQTALTTGATGCNISGYYNPFLGVCSLPSTTVAWNAIINPTGNQSLSMGNFTTSWVWGTATGTSNLVSESDTVANTGTGYIRALFVNGAAMGGLLLKLVNNNITGNQFRLENFNGQTSYSMSTTDQSGTGTVVVPVVGPYLMTHRGNIASPGSTIFGFTDEGGGKWRTTLTGNVDGLSGSGESSVIIGNASGGSAGSASPGVGVIFGATHVSDFLRDTFSLHESLSYNYAAQTGNYTANYKDNALTFNCTCTYTLPGAGTWQTGTVLFVKNIGSGTVTVSSSVNIDGATSRTLAPNFAETYLWNGSQYYVLASNGSSTGGATDVSGSRSVGTPFQNTNPYTITASGALITSGSGVGNIACVIGPTSTPTLGVWENQSTATVTSGSAGFICTVPAGYWYEVLQSGAVGGTVQSWIETH